MTILGSACTNTYQLYPNSIVDTTSYSSNYKCTFPTEIHKVIWDNSNKFQRHFPFQWHLVTLVYDLASQYRFYSNTQFFSIYHISIHCTGVKQLWNYSLSDSTEYGSSKMGTNNKTFMLMHALQGNNKDLLVQVTPLILTLNKMLVTLKSILMKPLELCL